MESQVPAGHAREQGPLARDLAVLLGETRECSTRDGFRIAVRLIVERGAADCVLLRLDIGGGDGRRGWTAVAGKFSGMGRGPGGGAGLFCSGAAVEPGAARVLSWRAAAGMVLAARFRSGF